MNWQSILTHPAVQALGWSLLHFLWQGALLALCLWVVLAMTPVSWARFRYAAAACIMLLMPVTIGITFLRGIAPAPAAAPVAAAFARMIPAQTAPTDLPSVPWRENAGVPGWAVCIWAAGVLLLSVRAAGGWLRARRLIRRACAADHPLQEILRRLEEKLRMATPVRLAQSAEIAVPMAIGWLRPYVLLPVTALTGLTDAQIQAVLAHELAHIRRHDYLVNLLQTGVETLLFYQPAVWWVGLQMRIEREHCCDDIAVAASGNALDYAAALAELERIRCGIPEAALAATGGDLLGRIRRLLGQTAREERTARSFGTIAAAVLVVLLAGVPAVRSLDAQPEAPAPPAPPTAPLPPAPPAPAPPPAPPAPPDSLLSDAAAEVRDLQQAIRQIDASDLLTQIPRPAPVPAPAAPKRTPEERAKTTQFLIKLYDSEKNMDMKQTILSYLARSDEPQAVQKVQSILRSDTDPDLRMAALSWVARQPKSYDTLASMYDSEKNLDMKMALLSWIAQSEDPRATDKLMSVAQSDSNLDLRQAALSWLVRR